MWENCGKEEEAKEEGGGEGEGSTGRGGISRLDREDSGGGSREEKGLDAEGEKERRRKVEYLEKW